MTTALLSNSAAEPPASSQRCSSNNGASVLRSRSGRMWRAAARGSGPLPWPSIEAGLHKHAPLVSPHTHAYLLTSGLKASSGGRASLLSAQISWCANRSLSAAAAMKKLVMAPSVEARWWWRTQTTRWWWRPHNEHPLARCGVAVGSMHSRCSWRQFAFDMPAHCSRQVGALCNPQVPTQGRKRRCCDDRMPCGQAFQSAPLSPRSSCTSCGRKNTSCSAEHQTDG
jgi:hypothetical protein